MDTALIFGIATLALAIGAVLGWVLASSRVSGVLSARAEKAERALKDESARAQAAVAAAQAAAKRDVAAMQAELASRVERLTSDHRAEQEKLARHLTDAYDELDKLRVRGTASARQSPPDTGQDFPATLPMGDL